MPKKQGVKDSIGELIAELESIEREYLIKNELAIKELVKIETAISTLEIPAERILLRKRYIEGKRWEQIAEDMSYSIRQIHRLHSKALRKLKN